MILQLWQWFKLNKRKDAFILISILIFILSIQYYFEHRNNELLKNSKTTFGIITKIYEGNPKSPKHADFEYYVNSKKYEFNQTGNYDAFKIGDTVLLEYSIQDHSVARVINKYYMRK